MEMTTIRLSGEGTLSAALALSSVTRRPFFWEAFRRRARAPSGFREADCAFVRLFAELSGATVGGGEPGDTELEFTPEKVRSGDYRVELRGEEPLLALLRAAALPLAFAEGSSTLVALGSTHALDGDTFEVSQTSWLYWMKETGIEAELHLEQAGFAPRGGGEVKLAVPGSVSALAPLMQGKRDPLSTIRIVSAASSLPAHVHQRQAARARSGISVTGVEATVQLMKLRARGSGSTVAVTGLFGALPITTAAIAERGRSAENVGELAAAGFRRMFASQAMLPPCLFGSVLVALSLANERSQITTSALPRNIQELMSLAASFTEREIRIESGKPGQPGAVVLEPASLR
jgi:RNA 3'-terminal phosphate cyclase (ATP)